MFRWIISLLAFLFWCGGSLAEPPRGTLYFLNEPESVCKPGIVARLPLLKTGRARLFFHFKNCTGKTQEFSLAVNDETQNIRVARDVRVAYAIDEAPEQAGIRAAHQFMLEKAANGCIDMKASVGPWQTVSGIAEGIYDVEGGVIVARMGEGDVVQGMKVTTSDWLFESFERKLAPLQIWRLRLGEDRAGRISGDYGSTLRVGVQNVHKQPLQLRVVVSPRGGDLAIAYRVQSRVVRTPILAARSRNEILRRVLQPGERFCIDMIPAGGFNYPVEFRMVLDPLAASASNSAAAAHLASAAPPRSDRQSPRL